MSLAGNYSLYERIDNLSKSVISPAMVLIWSFVDPIQPKVNKIEFCSKTRYTGMKHKNEKLQINLLKADKKF